MKQEKIQNSKNSVCQPQKLNVDNLSYDESRLSVKGLYDPRLHFWHV